MKIVVTGAESSGKTTLCCDLADYYNTTFTKECARDYLLTKGSTYEYSDLLAIARKQHFSIIEGQNIFLSKIHLVDTDLLTIKIWSMYKYNNCAPWVVETLENCKPDLYLLCAPDIPWEEDPLRENPNDRKQLFQIYKNEIEDLNVPYEIIAGDREKRMDQAIKTIESIKNSK